MESEQPLADWVGLDSDEAALYRALLRDGGPARPERLAAQLDRTVPDVRGDVERLADLGFLTPRGPVAPSVALRSVLHRRLAGLHEQQSALEAAAAQVDRLAAGFLAAEPGSMPVEGAELVVGREEVARRAGDMVATARHEMLILDAPPYAQVAPPAPDQPCEPFSSAADSDVGQAIARGVQFRRVIAQDALDLPGRMAAISELVELGLAVRVTRTVPTKLMIADGRTALVPPSPTADPASQALVVHDGLLLNVLKPFFEVVWDAAMPLGGASDAPSEADRALLALLAGGLKDEAIARQLDVHVHTARRRISALLERLGVTTRFQAGMQAARRGWLAELPGVVVGSPRSRCGSPAGRGGRPRRDPPHPPRPILTHFSDSPHTVTPPHNGEESPCGATTRAMSSGGRSTPSRGPVSCCSSRVGSSSRFCSGLGSGGDSSGRRVSLSPARSSPSPPSSR
ncbi:hypothetical protein [Phytomonospora endophytica]|uniref:DNA-binding CsgD family transcriptional regulator n=1 Tax=Phytomonospora endophytica TaxID=714109 RepID=A0A841G4U9_9ACTN|nr:hypothetical protein [Phytomonospora endophytica]MBB6039779.1 DNA-binding CsgD family transcriptional regulator [Phytomonospora endophytica]GIG70885.1 hypothetical protein Pen01_71800 [Phytomonospora endophytica]